MSLFYKPTKYNGCTKNQMWMSTIGDCHDIHCGCERPFAHLLDSIFPEGHQDRNKTIAEIIQRDLTECLSGGQEEDGGGLPLGSSAANLAIPKEEEEEDTKENIEELLAAAAAAEER
ncbi:ORF2 [Torque teno midi virus 3]|uniref:ORF2 n=1 Tax=Torque teno midi virus 3 TaxID=2065044 RepID=A8DMP1_9VIRU|nr:ORF2 [Torque teno midi virus 3]ABU55875.1 ORF2 [Torque teno midi virus 3]